MRITRRLSHGLVGVVIALLAVACATDQDATTSEQAPDAEGGADETDGAAEGAEGEDRTGDRVDVLRLAGGDFGYPTPFAYVRGPGSIQAGYIFDTLAWWDSTGEVTPWLARDWEVSEDGLTWTVELREDVQWHDGTPLTADDVVFTVEYMTGGSGADFQTLPVSPSNLESITSVEAVDETTVRFELETVSAAFEENVLRSLMIVPEHIWSEVDDPARFRGEEALVGSGPYRLIDIDQDSGSYLYEANDDFWYGPPRVERLEFIPMPDEVLGLQRGEIAAGRVGSEEGTPDEVLEALEAEPNLARLDARGDWNMALHFNLAAGFPYDDVRFRQAVALALDREDLLDRLLFGRGEVGSTGGLAPAHPDLAPDLPEYRRDLDAAAELLDEIGLRDEDGDGVRELPDGEPFVIELNASNRFSVRTPEIIREYLAEAGLEVEINVLDRSASDEAGVEGDYTMALHGYGGIMTDADRLRVQYSSQAPGRAFTRAQGYANDRFDELAAQQIRTADPDERLELLHEMQRILAEDLPVLSLYVPDRIQFHDESLYDGWFFTPGCSPCGGNRNRIIFVTGDPVWSEPAD